MRGLKASLIVLVLLVLLVLALASCHKKAAEGAAEPTHVPEVTAAATDLLFTWIDEQGNCRTETSTEKVPEASRELVRVIDPQSVEPPGKMFLVDLRAPGPDGKYAVRVAPRDDFEGVGEARRATDGGGIRTATSAATAPPAGPPEPLVIIYGASWCGPCHQAADYLKKKGIAYVLKDIEADGDAQREMQRKLAKAGRRGGSIPVIDVRGKLLIGFSAPARDDALGRPL